MQVNMIKKSLLLFAIGMAMVDVVQAFGFGNMMNPNRWFGGDRDRYDDNYYGAAPYGYGYPGGYAAPGYAAPGYAPPGYAAPGYAAPVYGVPAYTAPAVAAPAPAAKPAPAASAAKPPPVISTDEAEIARLKERIRELEAAGETPDYTVPTDTGAAGSTASPYPANSPYNQQYRFPDNESGSSAATDVKGQPEYPVYSPFGPPAEFPPLEPDSDVPVETGVAAAPAAAPVAPAAPANEGVTAKPAPVQQQAAPTEGVVNFTPGNPAAYVPPMQDTGQKVYDLGH